MMTIGSHQQTVGKSQAHITPKWLVESLGEFDLDPCAHPSQPWPMAKRSICMPEDGLEADWAGRVWLNPPFDRYQVGAWVEKLAFHGSGTLLIHARTETKWFRPVWKGADLILFLGKRVKFCTPEGMEQPANSGAPVVLAAFGKEDCMRLRMSLLPGAYVSDWATTGGYL